MAIIYTIIMANFNLNINGKSRQVEVDPTTPILWVLRDHLKLVGTKYGCGVAQCGACTIHLGDTAVRSCQLPISTVGDQKITTIEGLGGAGALSPLQTAFVEHTAFGCGYCTPGMIVTATALLERNPHPARDEIIAAMDDNLCRCASYPAIIDAIEDAANTDGDG